MDKLEFLDGAEAPNEDMRPNAEPPVEPQASEPVEATAEPIRDNKGRFASKQEPAPVPVATPIAPEPAPAPQAAVPEGFVPLAVVKELRDEIRALKAPQPQAPPPVQQMPQSPPDMFEDPDGYNAYYQQQITNTQLNISEEMSREKFGDELVDAAKEWATAEFQKRPGFAQEVLSQRNPYGYAVKAYQKHLSMQQLGDDPNEIQAYLAWKQAQSAQPQPVAPVPPQPVEQPPKSIANAPSAGGVQHTAVGPGVAFDNVIRN